MSTTTRMGFTGLATLTLLVAVALPARAQLEVGVAKVDVTPPPGARMYGYGARGQEVATGSHDPLWAKAIVLKVGDDALAWVTLDLGYADTPLTTAVRNAVSPELGLDAIHLTASHTHSGPRFDPAFPEGEASWAEALPERIAAVIGEAHAARTPARLSVDFNRIDVGHNRRRVSIDGRVEMLWENRAGIPTSPVDKRVWVVAFNTPLDEPIATLVHLAVHPVVLGPDNLEYSADYPGAMVAHVEEEIGGMALFLQGAAGDINPFWDKTPLDEGAFEQMTRMGETVGAAAVRIRQGMVFEEVESLSLGVERVEIGARWDLDDPEIRGSVRADYLERYERESSAEISTVMIGPNLALATFPGEFFIEHGLRLSEESIVPTTLFVGYSNGHLGYFPTIKAAAEGGYGADSSTIVEVGAGERLVDRALINLGYLSGRLSREP